MVREFLMNGVGSGVGTVEEECREQTGSDTCTCPRLHGLGTTAQQSAPRCSVQRVPIDFQL